MNRKDLQDLILVRSPWDNPEVASLAVLYLNNRLFILILSLKIIVKNAFYEVFV